MGGSFGDEVGHALRRARLGRGLTLRQVGERSGGLYKPTAVAGYERAERSISLERFCELCAFYGIAPGSQLEQILEAVAGSSEVIVDLTRSDDSPVPSPS